MQPAGTGHIERLPSGSYRVHVYAGTDPLTGRRLRYRQTVRTERQAQIVLGRLLEQAEEGQRPDTDVTVAEVLARYMAVAELDPSTRNTYAGYIRRTIVPALGAMELRKVRGPLLDTFYGRLRRCGDLACTGKPFTEHRSFPRLTIEPGNARSAWRRASAAIREAVGSGQLAPGEQLPSVRELAAQHGLPVAALRHAFEELARDGVIAVHHGRRATVSGGPSTVPMPRSLASEVGHDCARAECQPHRCRPMSPKTIRQIHAILSGAFAAAVRWEWIDRNPAGSAKLPKTRHRSPTSPTPTDVDAITAAVLAERKQQQVQALLGTAGVRLPSAAYVFASDPLGLTPWNPDWVTHKVAEVAEGAGVSLNIKALRHYTASQLLAGGIDLRNTAARLGHGGGGATTLRHYADPVSEVDRRAAAYLAQLTAHTAPSRAAPPAGLPSEER